jgi:hypothetical protein
MRRNVSDQQGWVVPGRGQPSEGRLSDGADKTQRATFEGVRSTSGALTDLGHIYQ